jgi:hypothetical protein
LAAISLNVTSGHKANEWLSPKAAVDKPFRQHNPPLSEKVKPYVYIVVMHTADFIESFVSVIKYARIAGLS